MDSLKSYSGIRSFIFISVGQLVSLIGSGLTRFALGVWIFQQSGSSTLYSLIFFFGTVPSLLVSPISGALVDRWDKKWCMIISDSFAAFGTLLIALLVTFDMLEIWHLYVIIFLGSISGSIQWPAYSAAVTLLIPKKHLARAGSVPMISEAISKMFAPAIAGVLLGIIYLQGIILIDIATFIFAVSILVLVPVPQPGYTQKNQEKKSLLKETLQGWRYISERPGLLGMILYFFVRGFMGGTFIVLITPYILSFASVEELGILTSFSGLGLLLGGFFMAFKGGPRRLINGVYIAQFTTAFCVLIDGLFPSVYVLAVNGIIGSFCFPLMAGCSQAIWQRKVPFHIQGRVFAVRRMIGLGALPIAFLLAGPLADYIFEPLMRVDGYLSTTFISIIGVGKGRGIGLLYIVIGILMTLSTTVAYNYKPIRYVEDELQDANV